MSSRDNASRSGGRIGRVIHRLTHFYDLPGNEKTPHSGKVVVSCGFSDSPSFRRCLSSPPAFSNWPRYRDQPPSLLFGLSAAGDYASMGGEQLPAISSAP